MIRREDLFQAIGELSEERLEQSEVIGENRNRERTARQKRIIWVRYAGIAAAACVILVLGIAIPSLVTSQKSGMDSAANVTMEYETTDEDMAEEAMDESAEGLVSQAAGVSPTDVGNHVDSGREETDDSYQAYDLSKDRENNGDEDSVAANEESVKETTVQDQETNEFRSRGMIFMIQMDDNGIGNSLNHLNTTAESENAGYYGEITAEEREKMQFVTDDRNLTSEDLGNYLGTTYHPDLPDMSAYKVYTTVEYPSDLGYVIVDIDGQYRLFSRKQ